MEASAPYVATATAESERFGHGKRATYRHGDFVELAESIDPADIVTLDRGVNVYPDWERLLELSASRAKHLYGLVYPRDRPFVRLVISVINTRPRLSGQQIPAAVRPVDAIHQILRDSGLALRVSESVGPAWQVAVYRRG